jgi:hypothetical protein
MDEINRRNPMGNWKRGGGFRYGVKLIMAREARLGCFFDGESGTIRVAQAAHRRCQDPKSCPAVQRATG